MKHLLLCLMLSDLVLPALALEWPTRQLSLQVAPLQKTAESAFAFINTGHHPVTILGLATSCDCTEATASGRTIAPGASGQISVRFTLGDRQGVYERLILVTTDEAKEPVTLRVQLDVPKPAVLTPRSLEWKLHGPAEEQTVDIRIAEGLVLLVTQVLPTSGQFNHRLETIESGRHYRLHLVPLSTQKISNAAFRLYAKTQTGEDIVISTYGNVR